jgi:beta-fructofuranosidase
VLELKDHWVWDCWLFDDGDDFHIFFLRASRALQDPDRRHFRASVGHAKSKDLTNWELLPDALFASDAPAWDEVATWTGSVVKNDGDGLYYIFYTGVTRPNGGTVQQVGFATSKDLITWEKNSSNPVMSADSELYDTQENGTVDTNFRDPWVFFSDRDEKWHMYVTADLKGGGAKTRATVAHAISDDLKFWTNLSPLHGESGFGQVEVVQVEEIDGRWVMVFCVGEQHLNVIKPGFKSGTYSVPMDTQFGPIHFDSADIIDADGIYAGRIIKDRSGQWVLLGFENGQIKSEFQGRICNPIPLEMTAAGTLKVKASS